MALLHELGADLSYHDPHIAELGQSRSISVPRLSSQDLTATYLATLDVAVVITHHSSIDWAMVRDHARLVVDTRNVVPRAAHVVPA